MDDAPNSNFAKWAVAAALSLLVIHAAVAVAIDLNAYADGAWFDFALRVDQPWRLVWRNYPVRLTPYLLEFLPAQGLMHAGAPARAAIAVAHALRELMPAASLALCWQLLPRPERAVAVLPAAYWALFGLLTWGFPTEIWLVAVFAWPAMILFAYGPDRWSNAATGGALVLAGLFSHEAAVILVPVFVLAGAVRLKDRPPRNAIGALVAVTVGVMLMAGAKLLVTTDPIVSQSVGFNAARFFGPAALVGHPALGKQALVAAVMLLAVLCARARPRLAWPALLISALLGLMIVLQDQGVAGAARYQVRSVSLLALAAMMVLAVLHRRWSLGPLTAAIGVPALGTALILMVGAVAEQNLRFALVWSGYERALSAAVNCTPSSCGPAGAIPSDVLHSPAAWPWGMPMMSVLLARDPATAKILRDDPTAGAPIRSGLRAGFEARVCPMVGCVPRPPAPPLVRWFMPLHCADAASLTVDGQRPRMLLTMTQVVCAEPGARP